MKTMPIRTPALWAMTCLTLAALCGGCANRKVPLTQKLIDQYNLTPSDLMQLQYYVSSEVKLANVSKDSDLTRSADALQFRKTRHERQIIVHKDLPGVAEQASRDRLGVSFEVGGNTFSFVPRGGMFYLSPSREEGSLWLFKYDGLDYYGKSAPLSNVYLLIEESGLTRFTKETKTLPGRKVSRSPFD